MLLVGRLRGGVARAVANERRLELSRKAVQTIPEAGLPETAVLLFGELREPAETVPEGKQAIEELLVPRAASVEDEEHDVIPLLRGRGDSLEPVREGALVAERDGRGPT